jgi:SAM-dependent methyltransferase
VIRRLGLLAAAAVAAGAYWERRNPSACPYSQRWMIEIPHPLISRARLREILEPAPGERLLEIGPGTGYYTAELADWVGPKGTVEIFDIQQEMLDHTMRRMSERGIENVTATRGDACELPYEDSSFDAVVLVTVLGEIPDQDAALREIARVLRPGGRLDGLRPARGHPGRAREAGPGRRPPPHPPLGYHAGLLRPARTLLGGCHLRPRVRAGLPYGVGPSFRTRAAPASTVGAGAGPQLPQSRRPSR